MYTFSAGGIQTSVPNKFQLTSPSSVDVFFILIFLKRIIHSRRRERSREDAKNENKKSHV